MFVVSIFFSTVTILTQISLSHFIRKQISKTVDNKLLRDVANEMVAAAEMCGAAFELIILADNYGVTVYAVYLFLMTIWWNNSWGDATACPYNLLEDYVEKGEDLKEVLLKIVGQTIGGLASFRWVKQLWMLEMISEHTGRGVEDCTADLKVPMFYGLLIECILTCFCRLVSRSLGELKPKYALAIDSFFATSMVVLAFDYSGGYFNPVLATGLKWGCRGHSHTEHVLVYWAGSIMGSMLSIKLWNMPTFKEKINNVLKPIILVNKSTINDCKSNENGIANGIEQKVKDNGDKQEIKENYKEEKHVNGVKETIEVKEKPIKQE